jgi:ribosomal protein RSM22 (predicted rRNA methylase)
LLTDYGCGPGTTLPAALEAFDGNAFPVSKYSKAYKDFVKESEALNSKAAVSRAHNKKYDKNDVNAVNTADIRDYDESFYMTNLDMRTVKEYVGVDNNVHMLAAAKKMCSSSGVNCKFVGSMSDVLKLMGKKSHGAGEGDRFDLVMASFVLSELKDDVARKAVTQLLVELLNVHGCLVIIEDGHYSGNHTVRTARQFILDAFNNADRADGMKYALPPPQKRTDADSDIPEQYDLNQLGVSVVAPCTHDQPCPLGAGKKCTFGQKVR